MTQADCRWAVAREMQTDAWYVKPLPDEDDLMLYIPEKNELLSSRNGNGHIPKVIAAAG